ncbi:MAG: XRE family transcriptional regulator [Cytophagales bacterium]|nr:MAG: XRE family transcriptional regulator [Cytophagales bacterium]TAF61207.1 MAG: XRE family transcriptional regulator [Cytophagales bacterium]
MKKSQENTALIGNKIRHIRELKDYTQEFLAETLQISQSSYARIETGTTDLTITRLYQISDVLGVTPSELLGFDERQVFNISNSQTKNGNGIMIVNGLTDEERHLYQEQINFLKTELEFVKSLLLSR